MNINNSTSFSIRFATDKDVEIILFFIKELAKYENLLDEVVATKEILYNSLFVEKSAEVIIAEYDNKEIGFALFFHNFSTFLGKKGMYLEDLYIVPEMRGRGYGIKMFAYLADIAKNRNCERLEWWCLDSNSSSIEFYKQLAAQAMEEWTVFRLTDKNLDLLANSKK